MDRMDVYDVVVNRSVRGCMCDVDILVTYIDWFDVWRSLWWRGLCMHAHSG